MARRPSTDIQADIAALAGQAYAYVADRGHTSTQKQAHLDRTVDPKMAALNAELAEARQLETSRRAFGGVGAERLGDIGGGAPTSFGISSRPGSKAFGVTKSVDSAPPIVFSPHQMEAAYDALVSSKSLVIEVDTKGPSTTTTSPMAAIPEYRLPPLPQLREPARVLNLLPASPTNAGSVEYFQVQSSVTAAAAVAEGAVKPESSIVYAPLIAPIRKLAHFITATDEALADYSNFLNVIQQELLAGLIDVENTQLLSGSGVAPNLTGILTTSGILTRARATDTRNDAIMKAITDIRTGASFAAATAIVMNPVDYQATILEKDTQGRYTPATRGPSPPTNSGDCPSLSPRRSPPEPPLSARSPRAPKP